MSKNSRLNLHCAYYMIKQITSLSLFLTTIIYTQVFAQDSVIVHQENVHLYTNKYIFYSSGIFKHVFSTDDGQVWYGVGTYQDKRRKRILNFSNPDLMFKSDLQIHYESNFSRRIKKCGKKFKSKDFYNTTRRNNVIFSRKEEETAE